MEESGTTLNEDEIRARMNGARDPTLPGKRGSDVTPKKVHWTWPDHIPRGAVVEYYGDPGNFKSGLAIDIAARMTTGKPFPLQPENTERKPAKVLFFSAEDDLETTLVPRFMAAGGDLESIHFVTATDKLPSLPDEEKVLRLYIKS